MPGWKIPGPAASWEHLAANIGFVKTPENPYLKLVSLTLITGRERVWSHRSAACEVKQKSKMEERSESTQRKSTMPFKKHDWKRALSPQTGLLLQDHTHIHRAKVKIAEGMIIANCTK